ncbi:MAG TPA: hypothetical protein PLZ24_15280 [Flavobacteriales bacterium]|nr:hypothetical protein [Flavobacteriales bacterium]
MSKKPCCAKPIKGPKGDPGDPPIWGNITGDINDQTDLFDTYATVISLEVGLEQAAGDLSDAIAQEVIDRNAAIADTLTDSIGGLVETAADTTYRLGGPSAFAYTIESLDVETDSGTITVAVKINGTAVTGLSAVSASSTPASAAATAANVVAVGDYLTFEGSSNSAATGLLFGITITRTP